MQQVLRNFIVKMETQRGTNAYYDELVPATSIEWKVNVTRTSDFTPSRFYAACSTTGAAAFSYMSIESEFIFDQVPTIENYRHCYFDIRMGLHHESEYKSLALADIIRWKVMFSEETKKKINGFRDFFENDKANDVLVASCKVLYESNAVARRFFDYAMAFSANAPSSQGNNEIPRAIRGAIRGYKNKAPLLTLHEVGGGLSFERTNGLFYLAAMTGRVDGLRSDRVALEFLQNQFGTQELLVKVVDRIDAPAVHAYPAMSALASTVAPAFIHCYGTYNAEISVQQQPQMAPMHPMHALFMEPAPLMLKEVLNRARGHEDGGLSTWCTATCHLLLGLQAMASYLGMRHGDPKLENAVVLKHDDYVVDHLVLVAGKPLRISMPALKLSPGLWGRVAIIEPAGGLTRAGPNLAALRNETWADVEDLQGDHWTSILNSVTPSDTHNNFFADRSRSEDKPVPPKVLVELLHRRLRQAASAAAGVIGVNRADYDLVEGLLHNAGLNVFSDAAHAQTSDSVNLTRSDLELLRRIDWRNHRINGQTAAINIIAQWSVQMEQYNRVTSVLSLMNRLGTLAIATSRGPHRGGNAHP